MKLEIRDKDDIVNDLNFPAIKQASFTPVVGALKKRVGHKDRFGKAGAAITGDQEAELRMVTFAFDVVSENDANYRKSLNELAGFLDPSRAPHYLVDTDENIRARIVLISLTDRPAARGLERIIGRESMSFKMPDVYWEDLVETTAQPSGGSLSNNGTFVVNNDAEIITFPIIKLRPNQSNTDVLIRNDETGAAFLLGSNSFVPGSEFIVDAQKGTILLDNGTTAIENSVALADGSGFIFLQPGDNTIRYESLFGDVEIDVIFRRRYAF